MLVCSLRFGSPILESLPFVQHTGELHVAYTHIIWIGTTTGTSYVIVISCPSIQCNLKWSIFMSLTSTAGRLGIDDNERRS